MDMVVARTLVMTLMVFLQNIHAFNCRSEKQSVFKTKFQGNWFFLFAVLISIGLQILFIEVPALSGLLELTTITYGTLCLLILTSLIMVVVCELYKLIIRNIEKKKIIN